jgi:hypothetical protein
MFEKARKAPAAYITIFVDGCRKNGATIFFVPGREICPSTKE